MSSKTPRISAANDGWTHRYGLYGLLRAFDMLLEKVLPPMAFCRVQEVIRKRLGRRFSGELSRTLTRENGMFRIRWSDGSFFYFSHPRRFTHYMKMEGLPHVHARMLQRYQDDRVLVPGGGTVIEAGAYCGEFTTAAAKIAGRIYSFDPDPNVYPALTANTADLENVEVRQLALGDKDGTTTLFVRTGSADSSIFDEGSTIGPGTMEGVRDVPTQMLRLDTFLAERGIETVDFLKLEAEGAEPEILLGAGERLKDIRMIAADCGPERQGQTTFDACEAILAEAGFETWRRIDQAYMLFARNLGNP